MDAAKINFSLLECGLCLDIFDDPRNLPCGHTFCFKCIQKLVDANIDRQPSCALCRIPWSVPTEGFQGLVRNFVLNNFIKSFGQQTDSVIQCALYGDGDEHGIAEYFCIDCWDPLCATCNKMHKKTRKSKGHDVKKIKDITEADVQLHKQKEEAKCLEHKDKVLELYCNECNCAVCYICCGTSHFQHKCLGLAEVDKKFVEQIRREIDEGVKIKNSYSIQLATMNRIKQELENDYEQKLSELKLSVSKAKQENEKCFTSIIAKIDKFECDAEDSLMKMKMKETARLENIVASLKEKLTIQQQLNLNNEQHLLPCASVFQRAKACNILTSKSTKDNNFIPSIEKAALLPVSILKHNYLNANFSSTDVAVKFKNSFVISELKNSQYGLTTLSINNDKILIGSYLITKNTSVYICNTNGKNLSNFNVPEGSLLSAMWINNCQIIFTSNVSNLTNTVSETGDIIAQSTLNQPQYVYVSSLNDQQLIYVACWIDGLYRSVDAGKTWSLVFSLPDTCYLKQAIPLTKEDTDGKQIFWTRTSTKSGFILQKCVIDKQGKTTWQDVNMATQTGQIIKLDWSSMMAYDDNDTIFVSCSTDNAVYGFSVESGRQKQSLSITAGLDLPTGLTINKKERLLYVGNKKGVVKIFDLGLLDSTLVDIRIQILRS